jgi:hypothetical protein
MLDVEATYRTVPVWPPHKQFLAVSMDDDFFVDRAFPFGLATAGGIQGHVADATADILQSLDLGLFQEVDRRPHKFQFPSRWR